jgi:hypothetical protein
MLGPKLTVKTLALCFLALLVLLCHSKDGFGCKYRINLEVWEFFIDSFRAAKLSCIRAVES